MRRSLPVLISLIAMPAAAAPLEMRYLRSENLHLANQGGASGGAPGGAPGGAINWHDEVTLKLDLASNGKLAGTEIGRSREHNLHGHFTTEELQRWTHAWSGSWKQTGDTLTLEVVLDARTCTHAKTRSGERPVTRACKPVSKQIRFACTTQHVELLEPARTKREIWQCLPSGPVDLDRTPTPWTFGKTSCVKMIGGRSGFAYERC